MGEQKSSRGGRDAAGAAARVLCAGIALSVCRLCSRYAVALAPPSSEMRSPGCQRCLGVAVAVAVSCGSLIAWEGQCHSYL